MGSQPNLGLPASFHDGGAEIGAFRECLSSFTSSAAPDSVVWRWCPQGTFNPRNAYKFLMFDGVDDRRVRHLWSIRIPPKVKIFLWLVNRNRILTADNLSKRGWVGPSVCCLCGRASKCLSHLFFFCPFARAAWSWNLFSEPCTLSSFLNTVGGLADRWIKARLSVKGRRKHLLDLCIAATCWEIWLARNDCIFRDKLCSGSECGQKVELTVISWIAAYGS